MNVLLEYIRTALLEYINLSNQEGSCYYGSKLFGEIIWAPLESWLTEFCFADNAAC